MGSRCVGDALEITRPRRSRNPALATSKTPESRLEIRAALGHHRRRRHSDYAWRYRAVSRGGRDLRQSSSSGVCGGPGRQSTRSGVPISDGFPCDAVNSYEGICGAQESQAMNCHRPANRPEGAQDRRFKVPSSRYSEYASGISSEARTTPRRSRQRRAAAKAPRRFDASRLQQPRCQQLLRLHQGL